MIRLFRMAIPIGLKPVPTDPLAMALTEGGHGCLVVKYQGHVMLVRSWKERTAQVCRCTDGARNQPLQDCPECAGQGEVTA